MPAGNPAGYLPGLKKRLKKVGAKPYKPRSKRPKATIKFPRPGSKPKAPTNPTGGVEGPPPVPDKLLPRTRGPKPPAVRPVKLKPGKRGGKKRYFGRSK